MQLVAYGAQDIYLTGNPQITFFKVVYRRHTNFSMESIEQTINGIPSANGNSTVTISRNGDLVYKVYVTLDAETVTEGSDIVSEVELEIGGQRIDRHYKEWMQIWEELSTPESKANGLKSMKCDIGSSGTTGVGMLQVPLEFWFCRNPGLALPLIALQYHEVKLKFKWGESHNPAASKVIADYIYLDTDERRRFAQVSHEYLIEQVQRQQFTSSDGLNAKLNFNHPVKELIWTSAATNAYTDAILKLNGHDRFSKQKPEYFQLRQPYDYHTAVPYQNLPSSARNNMVDRLTGNSSLTNITGILPEKQADDISGADAFAWDTSAKSLLLHKNGATLTAISDIVAGDELFLVVTSGTAAAAGGAGGAEEGIYIAQVSAVTLVTGTDPENDGGWVTAGYTTGANEGLVVDLLAVPSKSDSLHANVFDGDLMTTANGVGLQVLKKNSQARTSQLTKKINVYSFGLKPEEHQPSGTCNFSRIDNAQLNFTGTPDGSGVSANNVNVYAVNYNVLRIMSGMGGLAYSN